ncbi:MAG: YkgJ family cysteine cluster protein [Thermoguttaceae bacterium]|jgi:lysine-N-methylase
MTLPIRTLPIVESWSCRGCGFCCRGTKFKLSDEDLKRVRSQEWEKHPDFQGVPIVTRHGRLRKYYQLGKRPDGACVFLTEDNLCRIHRDLGESAKPLVCRQFPFQLVPLKDYAYVTLAQYCPSVAAEMGRPLEEHLPYVVQLAEEGKLTIKPIKLPAIFPGCLRPWDDLLMVAGCLDRLMHDERYPLARRLAHGLQFCDLIERSRLSGIGGDGLAPFLDKLAAAAASEEKSGEIFSRPRRPERIARLLFRQILFEYLRLHPDYHARATWGERWRIIRGAMTFARGKGRLKFVEEFFPATTFASLEQPVGELAEDVLRQINRFYEKATAAKQYLLLGNASWTLVDGFRTMAVSHAAALWLLRLTRGNRQPALEDVFKVLRTIDRGLGYDGLLGHRHRRRVAFLNRLGELSRLLAWYAQ